MAKIETQYVLVGRDQTQRAFRSLRGNVQRAERAVFSLQNAFLALGAGTAIRSIANAGIEIQGLRRGLEFATGSVNSAAREFQFVSDQADRLGLSLQASASQYAKLSAAARGTSLEGKATREIFLGISEASRVLALDAEQTRGALRAVEQIISKGKVQAEELRGQLGERLPGAFQIAARSIGVTTKELDRLLDRGEVAAEDLLPAFARELRNTFGGQVESAAGDAQAAFNRLQNSIFELKTELAEGGLLDILADISEFLADKIPDAADSFVEGIDAARNASLRFFAAYFDNYYGYGRGLPIADDLRDQADAAEEAARAERLAVSVESAIADEIARQTAEARKQNAALIQQVEVVGQAVLGWKQYQQVLDSVSSASDFGTSPIEIDRSTRLGMEEYLDMLDRMEPEVNDVADAARSLGLTFTSAFEDAIVEGEGLREVMRGLLQDIARIAVRSAITQPFTDFFSGLFSGGGGAGKAIGGAVGAGRPYVVGERGPELFVPRGFGKIIPNNQLGGGGDVYINTTVNGTNLSQPQLLAALEANNQRVLAEVSQRRREGRL